VYEARATLMLAKAFEDDPIMTYYLNKLPKSARPNTLEHLIHLILTAAMLNDAPFYESGTLSPDEEENPASTQPKFQCAAVIVPPGKHVENLGVRAWWVLLKQGVLSLIWRVGLRGFKKLLVEYPTMSDEAKATVFLEGEDYHYLLIVGTDSDHRGKGLCAATLKEHQRIAQEKGVPIWLEASNKGAMEVYKRAGFENVAGKWLIGHGKCDAQGEVATGTEAVGLEIWPMVWWPENYKRKAGKP
jgi:GNAT superfamily N-acetyltransferase